MAAIIARITREKRDRDLRLLKEIKSSKSNSLSEPHPKSFIPEIHNKGRKSKTLFLGFILDLVLVLYYRLKSLFW